MRASRFTCIRSLVHEVCRRRMLFALNRSGPILITRFFVVHSQNFTRIFIGKIIHEHLSYQRARKTEIFESLELSCSSWAWFKLKTNLTTVTPRSVFIQSEFYENFLLFFEKMPVTFIHSNAHLQLLMWKMTCHVIMILPRTRPLRRQWKRNRERVDWGESRDVYSIIPQLYLLRFLRIPQYFR